MIANQLVGAGVDPGAVDPAELGEARRGARPHPARRRSTRRSRSVGEPGFSAEPYLAQEAVSDAAELEPVVDAILAANPGQVAAYRGGKEGLLGFFVGQVMKETQGQGRPARRQRARAREASPLMDARASGSNVGTVSVSADSGISLEELRLAARNHAMPLEALRWPITPAGLHYLLIHYDVPLVDPASFRLDVGGAVEHAARRSRSTSSGRGRAVEVAVTMECAGNGRALLEPRPISQPWLTEAVGTARWRGVPLAALLDEAAPDAGAVDVVFTGLDRGIEGEVEQRYERSLPLDEARGAGCVLAYEMNGEPLLPQHGFPAPAGRARVVRDDERQVAGLRSR